MRVRLFIALALIGATLALGSLSCSGADNDAGAKARSPILLLAIDGLEWNVLLPLMREGLLPNLQALAEGGTYGSIRSFVPTVSPALWTSVATGKSIEKHGIDHFRKIDPNNPKAKLLVNSTDRKTKAFWNILSDFDMRVHSIGWFVTHPVEPINGVMVSHAQGIGKPDWSKLVRDDEGNIIGGLEGQVWPEERQPEMFEHLRASDEKLPGLLTEIFGEFANPLDSLGSQLWDACAWSFRSDATYTSIAEKLIREEPFDLLATYMGGSDVVGHRFWRYYKPEQYQFPPGPDELENFARIIPRYYAHVDETVGKLIGLAPEGTTVILVSDHGMQSQQEAARYEISKQMKPISGGHTLNAVILASGPEIRPSATRPDWQNLKTNDIPVFGSMVDITPTLLALLGLPVGRDMDGAPIPDLIRPEWLARNEIHYIDSHDTPEWLEARKGLTAELPDPEERWEQLRALGYLK